jgi:hypothetical protein
LNKKDKLKYNEKFNEFLSFLGKPVSDFNYTAIFVARNLEIPFDYENPINMKVSDPLQYDVILFFSFLRVTATI